MAIGALLLFFLLSMLLSNSSAKFSTTVGVNYGQLGDNEILNALKNTDIQVSIMLPNELITIFSSSQNLSDFWVKTNVVPFCKDTKIRYLLIGNEILPGFDNLTQLNLVPVMRKMKASLKTHKLTKIKVGTTSSMNVLESSFPPSNGKFRSDISESIMKPMLHFLNWTKSFFFLDVYPYFAWARDPIIIDLDYALFKAKNRTYTDPITGLIYTNLFDQQVDAIAFAMKRLGYDSIRIWIAETGWPNGCDIDQIVGNIYNAATYSRNDVKKLTSRPPVGTPARHGWALQSFLFALYKENKKGCPGTERHFRLLYPNGSNVYQIDLSGKTPEFEYKPLPGPTNNKPYKGKIWCLVIKGANTSLLASALSYACSPGNKTCAAIQQGREYYEPKSLVRLPGYAFTTYWAQLRPIGATCFFNGLATQTAKDPRNHISKNDTTGIGEDKRKTRTRKSKKISIKKIGEALILVGCLVIFVLICCLIRYGNKKRKENSPA